MSTIQAGTLFLSCFLLLLLPLPSTPTTIYVTPTPQTPCPGKPCHTLSQYAENATEYLISNTTMIFLPGEHTLKLQVNVTDVDNFSMVDESEHASTIVCSGSGCGGFYFKNSSSLYVSGLNFVSDSHSIIAVHVQEFLLENCTFSNSSNTAFFANNSNLLLRGNTFLNNVGGGDIQTTFLPGGGIAIVSSNMTLQGQNTFLNNTCSDDICGGGAMYAENSGVNLEGNTSFINNTAMNNLSSGYISGGGGILFFKSTVDVTGHVNFINNSVSNAFLSADACDIGGGGASLVLCNATISGEVMFSNNSAKGESGCGGGLYLLFGSVAITGNVGFTNNYAGYSGGGIYEAASSLAVNGTVSLANNVAGTYGGGFAMQVGTVDIPGRVLSTDNYAGYGGGIDMHGGSLNISGVMSLTDNTAGSNGGGIYEILGGKVVISGTVLLTNNTANFSGGGIFEDGSSVFVYGTVSFTNNTAGTNGGGLSLQGGTVDITGNVLSTDNYASYGGGIDMQRGSLNISGAVSLIRNSAGSRSAGKTSMQKGTTDVTGNVVSTDNYANHVGGRIDMLKKSLDISGTVSLVNNSAVPSKGGGLAMQNGAINITGSVLSTDNYAYYSGGGIDIEDGSMIVSGTVSLISNSAGSFGGGLNVKSSDVHITGYVLFTDNYVGPSEPDAQGAGWNIQNSSVNITGTVSVSNNSADELGGGISITYSNMSVSGNMSVTNNSASIAAGGILIGGSNVTINNALVVDNYAVEGGGILSQDGNTIITGTASFINNSASNNGGAMTLIRGSFKVAGTMSLTSNLAVSFGGGIVMAGVEMSITGHVFLTDNYAGSPSSQGGQGGGIVMRSDNTVTINGTMSFTNNSATQSGGAIALNQSQLAIAGKVYFTGNRALSGGAIYVFDTTGLVYCSAEVPGAECIIEDCFFQNLSLSLDTLMVFDGNVAIFGSVLIGGSVDRCRLDGQVGIHSGEVFDAIADYSKQPETGSVISSIPFRVCLCQNSRPNCSDSSITAYPGETFYINATAVGQRNGTVLATVNAVTYPAGEARLGVFEDRQPVNECTELHYTFFSAVPTDLLILYVYGSCSSLDGSKERLSIPINLLPCPPAFTLSGPPHGCICEERLQKFTNSCNINNQTILRDGDFWVGYDNQSQDLILHPHCPLNYCKVKPISFTVNETDLQCEHNRTGLLCGACRPGLSLTLGSSQCLLCSDVYLSLLIPFAVMGLLLVLILLVLIFLTVKVGTISGLIFYANIVGANQNIFFPPGSKYFLGKIVIVSWIKLDLGIETCFYDGMDTYAKTWLQFVFPIYMCGLILLIILLKKHNPHKANILRKIDKDHPEAVLATLFILSYGKILRTIISALSYTTLEYPNNETETVWLYDANIKFLHGKHIPLFVVGVLFLIVFILPVTLLLLLGQCNCLKKLLIFSWMKDPVVNILDIYHEPYRKNHRYWPGLLLVIRLALLIVSGTNAFRNYSENLLAISAAAFLLLAWPWMARGRVYKERWIGVLEGSYMLNLGIFAVATLYVQQAGGNQAVVAYTSTGVAIATFIVTVFYRIYRQTKEFLCWSVLFRCWIVSVLFRCWSVLCPPQNDQPLPQNNVDEERPLINSSTINVP